MGGPGGMSPGYFGYLGPELEEWITAELALGQLVVLGRRTYEALAGLPERPLQCSENTTLPSSVTRCQEASRALMAEHAHLS